MSADKDRPPARGVIRYDLQRKIYWLAPLTVERPPKAVPQDRKPEEIPQDPFNGDDPYWYDYQIPK